MKLKPTEIEAARDLGEAILRFIVAMEDRRAPAEPKPDVHTPVPVASDEADHDRLLTTREAAELLRVSDRTLYNLTQPRGPIRPVRLGGAIRYAIQDVREAVEGMKDEPTH
ncbi:MAG: helix-turn-helix domain-containing protein [Pseudomonadota bacterium]